MIWWMTRRESQCECGVKVLRYDTNNENKVLEHVGNTRWLHSSFFSASPIRIPPDKAVLSRTIHIQHSNTRSVEVQNPKVCVLQRRFCRRLNVTPENSISKPRRIVSENLKVYRPSPVYHTRRITWKMKQVIGAKVLSHCHPKTSERFWGHNDHYFIEQQYPVSLVSTHRQTQTNHHMKS